MIIGSFSLKAFLSIAESSINFKGESFDSYSV
jgi:hypothetical protein